MSETRRGLHAALAEFPDDDATLLLLKALVADSVGASADARRHLERAATLGLPLHLQAMVGVRSLAMRAVGAR